MSSTRRCILSAVRRLGSGSGAIAVGGGRAAARLAPLLLGLALALPTPAGAQEAVSDILEDLGTAETVDEGSEELEIRSQDQADTGIVRGRVIDGDTGSPVRDATVILIWPDPGDGGEPRQEIATTDFDGEYEFKAVPAGAYTLSFVKSGYRASTMTGFEVQARQINRGDFPMPPMPTGTASQILQLDAFVVEQSTVEELMTSLELRLDSDALLNTFSAEEFSKFGAGDVAEALKRVAGVNVVEGQFAIIRGLEDRYSSTLYNAGPVPSPDPNRQSVQLDLFPSDVVNTLAIKKTFEAGSPSNSSGGSIDIVTHRYPDEFEIKLSAGTGFNDNAEDRFLKYRKGSAFGKEIDGNDVIESDFSASAGGRYELLGRELAFKAAFGREIDYATAEGYKHTRQPQYAQESIFGITQSGDLSLGNITLSGGKFDLTQSEWSRQITGYGGFGFELDTAGDHRIDTSIFYTKKEDETVQQLENGYFPNFDYTPLIEKTRNGDFINTDRDNGDFVCCTTRSTWLARGVREDADDFASRGALWSTNFQEGTSRERQREIFLTQANGDHTIAQAEGLHFSWVANYATTKQTEDSYGARVFYEPDDKQQIPTSFPVTVDSLGSGVFAANSDLFTSSTRIDEDQYFIRGDVDYERELVDELAVKLEGGAWYERAERDVDASFLENPSVDGGTQFAITAPTLGELGSSLFDSLDADPETGLLQGSRDTTNDSKREVTAGHVSARLTLFEDFDLLGGVRIEEIDIESNNDAFTGETRGDGVPSTFPTQYLFWDRPDNPTRGETTSAFPPASDTVFNDQILGIDVPIDTSTDVCDPPDTGERRGCVDLLSAEEIDSFINGEIRETRYLPAAGFTYRPIDGMSIRGAYSQTVARPSFREMGYYVTVELGTNDFVVGNPQLQLSDVESWDVRAEYSWGDFGDLLAVSGFYKTIDDPIEAIVVRNPLNAEESNSALFLTYFNNPNEATLWGIEVEGRKSLGFVGLDFLEYLSLGGNFTYIDAEVKRSEAELARAERFFGVTPEDEPLERFSSLNSKRRLFGQPEWIANADVTFDHPGWGTRATLAFFAISDVLDAAGSAIVSRDQEIRALTTDRYVSSFHQLDFIVSQTLLLPRELGKFTLKGTFKNLTNSTRKIIYDPYQTNSTVNERSVKIGRDYSFSFSYLYTF
ncbi:MAG: TonB-dependent receptor domain-containing protein [Myxococcota bacterium]